MAFTDAEIESVREIVGLTTDATIIADLADRLDGLNTAQAAAVRVDITAYVRVANGMIRIKQSGGKGTNFSLADERLHFCNKMRARLRYELIADAGLSDPTSIGWMRLSVPGLVMTDDESCGS